MSRPLVTCVDRRETPDGKIYCAKRKEYVDQPYKCSKPHCKDCKFPVLAEVVIPVGRCDECPMCYTERTPRAGYALDYHCKAMGGKQIDHYVEYDFELRPVPEWCPFYLKGAKHETT